MDPYRCLRFTSISIGVWNIVYCLAQFGILGWQVQAVKILQWEFENRQLPATGAIDAYQARFPGLYAIYTETPERRRVNAMFVIVLICLGLSFVHLMTTASMIYGAVKRLPNWIIPWFFTCAPTIIMCTAYAILWWSGDVFNEQLTMSVLEFVISLAINGPCFIIVLMYFLRLTGRLTSDKPYETYRAGSWRIPPPPASSSKPSGHSPYRHRGICEPTGQLPLWERPMAPIPEHSLGLKLRRRELERARDPRAALRQDYQNIGTLVDHHRRTIPIMPRRSNSTDQLPIGASAKSFPRDVRMAPQYSPAPQTAFPATVYSDSRERLVPGQFPPSSSTPPQQFVPANRAEMGRDSSLPRRRTPPARHQEPQMGSGRRDSRRRRRKLPSILQPSSNRSAAEERRKRDERRRIAEFSLFRRKSPQRVSFKSRPKVYQRTPESSLSSGNNHAKIRPQQIHTVV